jgi:hypothetical protein
MHLNGRFRRGAVQCREPVTHCRQEQGIHVMSAPPEHPIRTEPIEERRLDDGCALS